MTQDLWTFDFECFAHDWLLVAKRQRDGETITVWNDNESVQDFVSMMNPVLAGYNCAHYDNYLLKGILLDWEPERIKEINDTIINNDDWNLVWAMFQDSPWVTLPHTIDLMPDIVPRKGLKEIEANIGMSIVESSVPFDIARPLTQAERDESETYCGHDVTATEVLYDLRLDYLKSKLTLCELAGIEALPMLKHTNARIVSEVLQAERLGHRIEESYEIPDNIDQSAIPQDVIDYVRKLNSDNCTDKEYPSLEFMFHGCPTTVGLGGIHAAVPAYKETAGLTARASEGSADDRVILMQDIGSYYPSLIILNGYMSRAVPDASAYKAFYDLRMKAKADGDKETAEAAKLVLNTTYGTMKDTYNKMYDPMQATRVCLSGQLYILDLIEQLFRAVPEGLQLIQLNTDGWAISCPRSELPTIHNVVGDWQRRTNFTVETDAVSVIVQANVNNYVLRFASGKVKAKGGVVAKHEGGDFKSNSATIIDLAVVNWLLDAKPIEFTVNECDDIERFQIVAKAGSTFQKVIHEVYDDALFEYVGEKVQRVNRIYAILDDDPGYRADGGIFKVKMEDGVEVSRQRIPLTPEHCIVDNDNGYKDSGKLLTMLDKEWYIDLAKRKAKEFVTREKKEREQMADTDETNNELQTQEAAPKPTARKKAEKETPAEVVTVVEATPTFREKLLRLQELMAGASTGVAFDGVVSNISYEYADTQQYKAWLSKACSNLRLIFKMDVSVEFLGVITPEAKTPGYGAQANGFVTIMDVDSNADVCFEVSGFGSNVQSGYCNGGAQTNLLRNFILNNFLLDNTGREGDDQAFNAAADAPKNGYVSKEAKADIKQGIADSKAEVKKYPTDLFAKALHERIMEVRAIPGNEGKFTKFLDENFEADGTLKMADGHPVLEKSVATAKYSKAEEYIAKAPKAAE